MGLEVVDPRWLIRAIGLTLAAAAILAYLALCLLIYQGGWQLMLHPQATVDRSPSVPFQALRFDAAETGTPRLAGWWIPAEVASGFPTDRTILFLHDGDESLAGSVHKIELLHLTRVNIFAFDYRGYGQSEGPHPTERRMMEDASAALDYLETTRHIPAADIFLCGEGVAAVLAARLAESNPELPGFIADDPDPAVYTRAAGDSRAHLLPMRLLLQEHFDLAGALAGNHRPKLLIVNEPSAPDQPVSLDFARPQANHAAFRTAADPKLIVTFQDPDSFAAYVQALTRFMDEYGPR